MPEIKHTFQGGRMNKDLDKRLVPNGEYRDAMNIQVRTTTGDSGGEGDLGAVQNIKSAQALSPYDHAFESQPKFHAPIASIADDKNNHVYVFWAGALPQNFERFTIAISETNDVVDINYDDYPGRGLFFRDVIWRQDFNNSSNSRRVVVDYFGALQAWIQVCGGYQYGEAEVTDSNNNVTVQPGVTLPLLPFNQIEVTDASLYRVGMDVDVYGSNTTSGWGDHTGVWFSTKIKSLDTTSTPNTMTFYEEIDPSSLDVNDSNGEPILGVAGFKFLHPDRPLNFRKPSGWENQQQAGPYYIYTHSLNQTKTDRYYHITGINIIDNLLFWTDNNGEPKKINVDRCIAGTTDADNYIKMQQTQLMVENPSTGGFVPILASGSSNNLEASTSPKNNDLREEHVTVLRSAPRTAPTLEMSRTNRVGDVEVFVGGFSFIKTIEAGGYTETQVVEIGDELIINDEGVNISFVGTEFFIDDIITFTSIEEEVESEVSVKVKFLGYVDADGNDTSAPDVGIKVQILSVDNQLVNATYDWKAELELSKPLFEHKFVRFGYRYRYEDGEYSAFSPWSELAFLPDEFEYSPRKGFNLGMSNQLRYLCIKDFLPLNSDRPLDVSGVDILFKTTDSPTIYIVKTIERKIDPEWEYFTPGSNNSELQTGKLVVTSEMIHRIVPANQLLRSWDNVPRRALAQEIVGNRLVYGNYVQGYNLDFRVGLEPSVLSLSTPTLTDPKKSIKSLRNYKLGLVLGDKYGRETPVVESGSLIGNDASTWNVTTSDVVTEKQLSITENKLNISQDWSFGSFNVPEWIDYVKYYIKETSNEYYNLVMDRWYNADDGNIWLSFNSADRNKVDEETYLILKNAAGSQFPILEKARYKIIAIENEAPDFIKTDRRSLGVIKLDPDLSSLFTGTVNTETLPPTNLMQSTQILVPSLNENVEILSSRGKGKLSLRFIGRTFNDDGTVKNELFTHFVPLVNFQYVDDDVSSTAADLKISWELPFNEVVNMFQRFTNASYSLNTGGTNDLKYELEISEDFLENKPEFDGKFFVKIETDVTIEEHIMLSSPSTVNYNPIHSFSIGYISTQSQNPGANGPFSISTGGNLQSQWGGGQDENGNSISNNWIGGANFHFNVVNQSGVGNTYSGVPYEQLYIHTFALGCKKCDGQYSDFDGEGDCGYSIAAGGQTAKYWEDYLENATGDQIFIDNARAAMWAPYDEVGYDAYGQPSGSGSSSWYDNDKYHNAMSFGPDTSAMDGNISYSGKYYRPPGFDTSPELVTSTSMDAAVSFNRITFSILGDTWDSSGPTTAKGLLRANLGVDGALFRFANDTSNNGNPHVYKIVGTNLEPTRNGNNASTRNYFKSDNLNDESVFTKIFGPANSGIGPTLDYTIVTDFLFNNDGTQNDWNAWPENSMNYTSTQGWESTDVQNLAGGNESQDGVRTRGFKTTLNGLIDIESAFAVDYIPTWDGIEVVTSGFGSDILLVKDGCPVCIPGDAGDKCSRQSVRITFVKINPDNGLPFADSRGINYEEWDPRGHVRHDGLTNFTFEIVQKTITSTGELPSPIDGACWETEPKENVDLDIYYEASDAIPFKLREGNTSAFAPIKSKVSIKRNWGEGFTDIPSAYLVDGSASSTYEPYVSNIYYTKNKPLIEIKSFQEEQDDYSSATPSLQNYSIGIGDRLFFNHPNGAITTSRVTDFYNLPDTTTGNPLAPVETITATISKNTTDYQDPNGSTYIPRLITFNDINNSTTNAINGLQVVSYISSLGVIGGATSNPGIFLTNFGNIPDTDPAIPNIQLSYTSWMVDGETYTITLKLPTGVYEIDSNVYNYPIQLGWFNCYSFGNGVESDRVRDDFNASQIDNGVKVSSTFSGYGEENKSSGLIYSGIYNSISEVNNLNEFNQAEKITKDLNPSYGSIQRLKTRDTDVVTFCEDKVLKILANKDALFNADGNRQLTATDRVLGTAIPFVGDYGISKNPESLAVDQFRMYFTDKERGAVLRLSRDGLTPISNVGMKGWFRENLKDGICLVGTFDTINSEYNLSVSKNLGSTRWFNNNQDADGIPYNKTVSFNESAKGWTSFKSFLPDTGLSLNDKYILFRGVPDVQLAYSMYTPIGVPTYNDFQYLEGPKTDASLTVLFNDIPSSVKSFHTINYEGSQAQIVKHTSFNNIEDAAGNPVNNTSDGEFYNLEDKEGWYVKSFETDLQSGSVPEFINKENKWFNYIKGLSTSLSNIDTEEFTVQGLGNPVDIPMYISLTPLNPVINEGDQPIWIIHSKNIPQGTILEANILGPNSTATIDDLEGGLRFSFYDPSSESYEQTVEVIPFEILQTNANDETGNTWIERHVTKIQVPINKDFVCQFEGSSFDIYVDALGNGFTDMVTNEDGTDVSTNASNSYFVRIKEDFLTEGPEYIECVVAATDSNGVVTNLASSIITITDSSVSPTTYDFVVQNDPNN
tara:strand:+ start:1783 stop:9096 length:7314 start_codon:yes stop_codon:yes gene_type:complete